MLNRYHALYSTLHLAGQLRGYGIIAVGRGLIAHSMHPGFFELRKGAGVTGTAKKNN